MILISKIKRVETPRDCPSLKYFNVSAEDFKKLSATIKEIKIVDYISMVCNPAPPNEYELALIESIRRLRRKTRTFNGET